MKLILAQGNVGQEYDGTRHNLGFYLLNKYAKLTDKDWHLSQKFSSYIIECQINNQKIILAKPTTFYNETGEATKKIISFYKINPKKDLLVVHDDLKLPFGTIRVRDSGSDAGNNGIKNINLMVGQNYFRIKVGTWDKTTELNDYINFVLSKFNHKEVELINKFISPKINELISQFISDELTNDSIKIN